MTHFIYIENNKINGSGECEQSDVINYIPSEELYNDFKTLKTVEEQNAKYKWNGQDVVLNPDYEQIIVEKEKEKQRELLLLKIDDLDKKRIRAVCEPSVKDETTGETWLDYYNSEIQKLREQLKNL